MIEYEIYLQEKLRARRGQARRHGEGRDAATMKLIEAMREPSAARRGPARRVSAPAATRSLPGMPGANRPVVRRSRNLLTTVALEGSDDSH